MKPLSKTMRYLGCCAVCLLLSPALWAANRPFPQHETYAAGSIRPTNYTQAQQDQHVRNFYDYWKSSYLVSAGYNSANKPLYRIAFGAGSDITVSEGQGYGMVTVALMAGYDSNAQQLFDGLWYFSRKYPSAFNNNLMSWKVQNGSIVDGNDSAFDGDVDIAYSLLLAHEQWGSDGAVNYQAEAKTVINAIMQSTIGANSLLPKLGDWTSDGGTKYNQYTPRSSDFMPAHFRAFAQATQDNTWLQVISNTQTAINTIQQSYSATTGLLPDFIVNCQSLTTCRPASAGFLEGSHDGEYYYNAGRNPWRIGLDGLLNADTTSTQQVSKIIQWLASNTSSTASNIKAGYTLSGAGIGNYSTTFFVAPFGVAAMLDANQQAFLNSIYQLVYNKREAYYEDSVNMLSLLAMTGNYWQPSSEPLPAAACADGVDNDGDGLTDYPNDPGCTSATDNDETDPVPAQCADGVDNDGDGLTDYPNDPGCTAATDDDETDPASTNDVTVTQQTTSDWGTGYCNDVYINNPTTNAIDWRVTFTVDGSIYQAWNVIYSQSGQTMTAEGVSWNNIVQPNATVSFGYCANRDSTPSSYALTVSKTGKGNGLIKSSTTGISCGTDCSETYTSNTSVTLTAKPNSKSYFVGWSGACSGTSTTCTVSMDAAKDATANFALITYDLTVLKQGLGKITSSPAGITCGADCNQTYVKGKQVVLTATPATGYYFAGWARACSAYATASSCTLTMNAAKTAKAIFLKN